MKISINTSFILFAVFLAMQVIEACQNLPRVDVSRQANERVDSPADHFHCGRGALLATRFASLDELKSVVQIEYGVDPALGDSAAAADSYVRVRHCSNGLTVESVLESGASQGDFLKARYNGTWKDRARLLYRCPFGVSHRKDLEKILYFSRWSPELFGEGDPAFFDIARAMAENINTPDLAILNTRDTTEKGYINSFNHITAQAFITSCFSEELADFIADSHERYRHPELITGFFPEKLLDDLAEGPVDNYVDIVNNEWGQELGKRLKKKFGIDEETVWTPDLLAAYLNDVQGYYAWAFQIGFKPFHPDDERIYRFAKKVEAVLKERVQYKK